MTPLRLKVALIGTGGWARQHARILSQRPDINLCAVVGRDTERTALRASECGTFPYTSLETMLGEQHPDLVCVCLPNQHHFEATLQVIEAGYPLLDLLRKSDIETELEVMNTGDEVEAQTEAFAATAVTLTEDTKDLETTDDLLDPQTEASQGAVGLFFLMGEWVMLAGFDR